MAILVKYQLMSQETLARVSETTLQEPVSLSVDIFPGSAWQRKLQQWGWIPKQRVFTIRPIYLGTLVRISKLLLSIEFNLPDGSKDPLKAGQLLDTNYQAILQHSHTLASIVALAIQNNDKEPDRQLVAFVLRYFTTQEMMGVLGLVLKQMDLSSFMSSIISVRGLNVLENQTVAPAISANGQEVSL